MLIFGRMRDSKASETTVECKMLSSSTGLPNIGLKNTLLLLFSNE